MLRWLFGKKKKNSDTSLKKSTAILEHKDIAEKKLSICRFNTQASAFEKILYELKEAKSFKNILCIPSYEGELVYSLVLALTEAGISSHLFHVVGINKNKKIVEKAGYGTYLLDNISKINDTLLQKYFEHIGEKFKLTKSIKGATTFHNLDIENYDLDTLGKFDYIITNGTIDKSILEQICRDKNNILFNLEEEFLEK